MHAVVRRFGVLTNHYIHWQHRKHGRRTGVRSCWISIGMNKRFRCVLCIGGGAVCVKGEYVWECVVVTTAG